MQRLRFALSVALTMAILGTAVVALFAAGPAQAQTSGSFAVTSIARSCEANELIVNVENTTGETWSLYVGFFNSSSSSSEWVTAGDQGFSTSAVVPYSGDPFDQVSLDIRLSDGWRFSYGSFVGLCGEALIPEFQGSWPPAPQIDIEISNASCVSFDWFVSSDQPVRIEVGVIRPAAAGDFPVEVIDSEGGERSGTFVSGVDWPSMLLYVRVSVEVSPGVFEVQDDRPLLIEDCAAVAPTVPAVTPTTPAEGTTVTIVVTMPDGSSIEGAPWALYAPVASMQRAGAFATGTVGPNNTIVIEDLPDGDYTLVISPEGRDPITLEIAVNGGSDGTQVIPVNLAVPTETPVVTVPGGTKTPVVTEPSGALTPVGTSEASVSSSSGSVSGLPNTGSGSDGADNWLVATALVAVLMSATGAVVSHRFGHR